MNDVLLIVNPASAGGRTGREWPGIEARLRAAGLRFDSALTSRPAEATELARREVKAGRPLVVAAGGDGTVHEVANGFFERDEPLATASQLGVLPVGTGGDFRRTFGMPREPERAAAVLLAGHSRAIDAGRLACRLPDGRAATAHFVNIASAGIGGEVVARVNRGGRYINGEITFLVASVLTLLRWRNKPMRVVVDGQARELVAQQVVVANCQFFGGGMRVAPRAVPDDGLLDVVVVADVGALENLRGIAEIRRGTHLDAGNPKVTHCRARRVELSSPESVLVEADGEQPGGVPAGFEVVPGALRLVCPE